MIFERRQYTLRPGRVDDFWAAQRRWNVHEASAALMDANLSYFSTVAGTTDQIVHLYRFDSVDHWQESYQRYYAEQVPEYFTSVRPWALAQENSLLTTPPMAGLTDLFTSEPPRLPGGIEQFRAGDGSGLVVTEEAIDFLPGGLATYWPAYGAYREASATVAAEGHLGVLVTMVGPLHRVYAYRAFADADHALRYEETRRADPAWRAFTERYRNEVTGSRTSLLRPSPVPRQRSLFEPAPDRDGTSGTPLPTVATPGAGR